MARPFRWVTATGYAPLPLPVQRVERRDCHGVNSVTIQQSEVESFAPIVDELAGH
jgi:hypothetical protein